MTYWLNLFTVETWNEFLAAGGQVSGHTEQRWARAQKVAEGDRLLCYLVGAHRWVGVLECTGTPYFDDQADHQIWSTNQYPSRIPVRVLSCLAPEEAVPVRQMIDQLHAFDQLENRDRWGTLFMGSLNTWSDADGSTVERAIREALDNPVARPLPASATRRRVPHAVVETETGPVTVPDEQSAELTAVVDAASGPQTETEHTWAQLTLAKLGSAMGYQVYVPPNDRNRTFKGERLGDAPGMVEALSLPLIPAAQRIVRFIDVLWLDRDAVQAAFEIECTTSIYSGILRMTDLLALQPNLSIRCFIVAPDERSERVFQEMNRPTFARMRQPLTSVCRFIPFSALHEEESRGPKTWPFLRFAYVEEELSEDFAPSDD